MRARSRGNRGSLRAIRISMKLFCEIGTTLFISTGILEKHRLRLFHLSWFLWSHRGDFPVPQRSSGFHGCQAPQVQFE